MKKFLSFALAAVMLLSINTADALFADAATDIPVEYGETITNNIAYMEKHLYSFYVPVKGSVTFKISNWHHLNWDPHVSIYNSSDNLLYSIPSSAYKENRIKGCFTCNIVYTFTKGKYYMLFESSADIVQYQFALKYSPAFSNTSIKKLSSGKRAFKASWKKAGNANGYQIQYSLKKNMGSSKTIKISKNSSTVRTVKKLKSKRRYYVRVRTYKVVNVNGRNKTYYGKWSAKKSVKTK